MRNLHPPFGHPEREQDVKENGDNDDEQVTNIEDREEDCRNEQELQDQRPDRKQHETKKEIDALHTPVDDPRQSAGFPGDVVSKRQRMEMLKRSKRECPERPLPDAGKDDVSKFVETHDHQPCEGIGDGQSHRAKSEHEYRRRGRRIWGQRVDRRLEEEGCDDTNELGHEQRHEGKDNPNTEFTLVPWPKIRRHPSNDQPARLPVDLSVCHDCSTHRPTTRFRLHGKTPVPDPPFTG